MLSIRATIAGGSFLVVQHQDFVLGENSLLLFVELLFDLAIDVGLPVWLLQSAATSAALA